MTDTPFSDSISLGDKVMDGMCGNGTFGKAAVQLGRGFLGIERSPLYADQARKWIAAANAAETRNPKSE